MSETYHAGMFPPRRQTSYEVALEIAKKKITQCDNGNKRL